MLDVRGLSVELPAAKGWRPVVQDLSFSVSRGECLAIVGESGSGKSVTCLAMLDLVPGGGRISAGSVVVNGQDVVGAGPEQLRRLRGEQVSLVFQDPSAALNPLFTVEQQLGDVLDAHGNWSAEERRSRIMEVLADVQFPDPERRFTSYPHELSGGLRQRVAIAMALICAPQMIIADEPTTNLDVATQQQVIEVLRGLKQEHDMGLLFITHDIALAAEIADSVMVMYGGRAVEIGPTEQVLGDPAHPYTVGLLRSVPSGLNHEQGRLRVIPSADPQRSGAAASAPFFARCPVAVEGLCAGDEPAWSDCGPAGHRVACHRFRCDGREGTRWT